MNNENPNSGHSCLLSEMNPAGLYGSAYQATIIASSEDGAPAARLTVTHWVKDVGKELPNVVFVKCPDPNDLEEVKEKFLKEFESGQYINSAADRLAKTPQTKHSGDAGPLFKIARMLGKGTIQLRSGAGEIGCLVYDYVDGVTLSDSFNPMKTTSKVNSQIILRYAWWLARAVQVLHNQGVVHSFLVPRNIRLSGTKGLGTDSSFTVVGFGYARLYDAQGKVARGSDPQPDDYFRAPETRGGETYMAYWLPADIYSIGALLYYALLMISGRSDKEARQQLKNPPRDVRRLKAKISEELKSEAVQESEWKEGQTAVRNLIRDNENILKIIDSCLRKDQDQRFSCVEELMDLIEIAQTAGEHLEGGERDGDRVSEGGNSHSKVELPKNEEELADRIKELKISNPEAKGTTPLNPYFEHLRGTLAKDLARSYGNLDRGHLEVYGSRDRIIPSLCRLLGSARRGAIYDTLTLPDYWTDENLGSMGRFLTMNKHMVRKGVHIRRVFLVSKSFHKLTEVEQVILEAQLAAMEEIDAERKLGSSYGSFKISVDEHVTDDGIAEFENVGSTVAYLHHPGGAYQEKDTIKRGEFPDPVESATVCLNFFSTARARRSKGAMLVTRSIKKVRYWVPPTESPPKSTGDDEKSRFTKNLEKFKKHMADAISLGTYVRGVGSIKKLNELTIKDVLRAGR